MFGVVIGVIEGYDNTRFNKALPLSVAVGVVVMALVLLSMAVQVFTGMQFDVLSTVTLMGALFSNPFAGSGLGSRLMTLVLSFFYGMLDMLIGYYLYMAVHDFHKNYL